jgi:DNA-binding NarL/FixJ family response regulator
MGPYGTVAVVKPPRRPRVLLADDHVLVAEALKSLLSTDFELVGVVADGRELLVQAATLRPDVIVADITMPLLNGIDALVRLRQDGNRVPVVFLTMHRDAAFARRALEAGASGFVLKHLPHAATRGRGARRHEARARPDRRSGGIPHAAAA